MALLTRESILAAEDLRRETVSVPEWGGEVLVRALTGKERDAFENGMWIGDPGQRRLNAENLRARLVAATVIDESGKKLFSDADVEALGAKSGAALDRVYEVAARLSGIGKDDLERAEKNSGAGRS